MGAIVYIEFIIKYVVNNFTYRKMDFITICLLPTLKEQITNRARELDISRSELMRLAAEQFLSSINHGDINIESGERKMYSPIRIADDSNIYSSQRRKAFVS